MNSVEQIFAQFTQAATQPLVYAEQWKERTGQPVVGVLPMNFPGELVHAAGALPVVLQADDEQISIGLSRIDSFYCGYNRSLVNQTLSENFQFLDAIMLGDHCVQLLGTADTMRNHMPKVPLLYDQLVSTINATWAFSESLRCLEALKSQLEAVLERTISDEALQASIELFNRNRQMMRDLYELRQNGELIISAVKIMHIVQSSMVMDRAEHTALLEQLMDQLDNVNKVAADAIPVFLSGHMCHAPKIELLEAIESCGAMVVADDLYTGYRFIAADVEQTDKPVEALVNWYLDRNDKVPCPTRSARINDWDDYLVNAVKAANAKGAIVLQVKFCEPHLFYYPEIKEAFDAAGISHLLIEAEHEEIPMEALRTRLETFVEVVAMNG